MNLTIVTKYWGPELRATSQHVPASDLPACVRHLAQFVAGVRDVNNTPTKLMQLPGAPSDRPYTRLLHVTESNFLDTQYDHWAFYHVRKHCCDRRGHQITLVLVPAVKAVPFIQAQEDWILLGVYQASVLRLAMIRECRSLRNKYPYLLILGMDRIFDYETMRTTLHKAVESRRQRRKSSRVLLAVDTNNL